MKAELTNSELAEGIGQAKQYQLSQKMGRVELYSIEENEKTEDRAEQSREAAERRDQAEQYHPSQKKGRAEQHRIAEIRETEGRAEQHSKAEKKVEQKYDRWKKVEQKYNRENIDEHGQRVGGDEGRDDEHIGNVTRGDDGQARTDVVNVAEDVGHEADVGNIARPNAGAEYDAGDASKENIEQIECYQG